MKYYGRITDPKDLVTKEFTKNAISQHHDDSKITNPETKSSGQLLQYNGTAWVAADAPASGVVSVTAGDSTITIGGTAADPTVKVTENTFATYAQGALADTALQPEDVVDNVTSTITDAPLSANQGKALNDRINNLESIGRFLSVWNCTTGLPTSEPGSTPYAYRTGDYYRVGVVGATNYRPDGSSYTGVASTIEETATVDIGYIYYYDGTIWILQAGSQEGKVQDVQVNGTSILSGGIANLTGSNVPEIDAAKVTSGTFADERIASAETWNGKQDALVSGTNIKTINGNSILTSGNINASEVSVASTGTSTTEVQYITVNNTEYKLAGGSGTVQDVQINGTTIVASGTGIANITDGALSEVKYTAQSLTDAQKTQARTNINAIAIEAYDSTATPVDGILYYTTD